MTIHRNRLRILIQQHENGAEKGKGRTSFAFALSPDRQKFLLLRSYARVVLGCWLALGSRVSTGLGCLFRLPRRFRFAGVVGHVPSRSLQLEGGLRNQLCQTPLTRGAGPQRTIRKLL